MIGGGGQKKDDLNLNLVNMQDDIKTFDDSQMLIPSFESESK